MICGDRDTAQHESLCGLLEDYGDLFNFDKPTPGRTSVVQNNIDTNDAPPVKSSPYRLSSVERTAIQDHVTDMLTQAVIQESCKPLSSLVTLVKTKLYRGASV